MTTIVFQSFRTQDVPGYIHTCLKSVRGWAEGLGYGYAFLDDQFLSLAPEWYRRKAGTLTCVVTDLARLVQARTLLLRGYDQVIWMDADLLVFQPERLRLPATPSFRYCKEVWLQRTPLGAVAPLFRVNNSVCVFGREGVGHLDAYIHQCLTLVRATESLASALMVGTEVLTRSFQHAETIDSVGMLSPVLLQAVLREELDVIARYSAWQGAPVFAANLCNNYRSGFGEVAGLFDYLLEEAVAELLETQGGLLAASPATRTGT